MLQVSEVTPGLVFGSFLFHEDFYEIEQLKKRWEETYGPSFLFTPKFNPLAKYYASEMGDESKLKRFFVLSTSLVPRESLLSSKLQALNWEKEWSVDNKRLVNVDTGLLSAENFVLATTKNYSHRIYIGSGIFTDLTYHFHLGKFEIFPWTYPDYQDAEKLEFFTWARSYLLSQLTQSKT